MGLLQPEAGDPAPPGSGQRVAGARSGRNAGRVFGDRLVRRPNDLSPQSCRNAATSELSTSSASRDSIPNRPSVIAMAEEQWRIEVNFAQVKTGLSPVSPVLPDSDALSAYDDAHRVVARDRFGNGKMRHVQLRCLSSSAAQNIATPFPQGFSPAPSWWASERKTKTVCATCFACGGPSCPGQRPSLGSHAADAAA